MRFGFCFGFCRGFGFGFGFAGGSLAGGGLGRTRAPVVLLDVPRVYPPHHLAPEGLRARNRAVRAVLQELIVAPGPRQKLARVLTG